MPVQEAGTKMSHSHDGYRHVPDYDRCGWGTDWGCKEFIQHDADVSLVLNAAEPEGVLDNGHRLFHSACLPAEAVPLNRRKLQEIGASSNGARKQRALRAV